MAKKDIGQVLKAGMDATLEAAEREDTFHGLLSLLPAGGLLDAALFRRIKRRARERLEEFHSKVVREISRLDEEKLDRDFMVSDEFDTLVMRIVARTVWEHSDEKRKLLRQVLLNSVTTDFSGNPLKETVLGLLDELSPAHIKVLQYFSQNKARGESGFNSASDLCVNVDGLAKPLAEALMHDLFRRGLLDREQIEHFTNLEVSGLGKSLLAFLTEPG